MTFSEIGFVLHKRLIATKALRHEEKLDRITGLTEITEVFGRLGVLGILCSKSELLTQRLTFVHKAIETALFRSQRKTVLFSRKDAQNAQKSAKNDQKSALLTINTPF